MLVVGCTLCLLLMVPGMVDGAGVLPVADWLRYDLLVWFVLRGSMGRQWPSDSQVLS